MLRARTAHQQQLKACAPFMKKQKWMNVESLLKLFRSQLRRHLNRSVRREKEKPERERERITYG